MKKHIIVGLLFAYVILTSFLVNSFLFKTTTTSVESTPVYAKIIDSCYLKKTPTKLNDFLNIYFVLEESYFVKILNEENDFYFVEYLDLTGYVEKSHLQKVNEIISKPYLDSVSFDIIKETNLYNSPKIDEDDIKIKLLKQNNVFYYGKIFASSLDSSSGNVWYYCKIESNNTSINGYVHSKFCNNLSPILLNDEISTNLVSINNESDLLNLNSITQTIIIIVISFPILFILVLFLKGFKKV